MALRLPRRPAEGWMRGGYQSLRRLEARVLGVGLFVAACAWAFAGLLDFVEDGESGVDRFIFGLLRSPSDPFHPAGPSWLQAMARDVTSLGSWAVLLLLIAIVSLGMLAAGKRRLPLLVIGACVSGLLLSTVLKEIVDRDRPGAEYRTVETYTSSFPSGHAMNSAAVYLTLGALVAQGQQRRRGAIFALATGIGLAVLVGVTRVYLGVHWPTDVLAGWAAGFGWAALWWLIADRMRSRAIARARAAPGAPHAPPAP